MGAGGRINGELAFSRVELGLGVMKRSWGKWCDVLNSAVLYAREGVRL